MSQRSKVLPLIEGFEKQYTLAREFDITEKLNRYGLLIGKASLLYDADFGVFRRNPPAVLAPGN